MSAVPERSPSRRQRPRTGQDLLRADRRKGEINSVDLVTALDLRGPTSIPANLTNPLKKSARRLEINEHWTWAETPDGTRTIWKDRDGIAARMVEVIEEERKNRELV